MDARVAGMGEAERAVLRATEPDALAGMTEDELVDLHARVRRARTKYVGQYRRQASARVSQAGGRGKTRAGNRRAADRAEVFEAALARVSTALAKAARQSAAELKAERLEAARAAKSADGRRRAGSAPTASTRQTEPRPPRKSAGRAKKDASSIAMGARRQAKRDAR